MSEEIDQRLERLLLMVGTDKGFFVLATHSFIEKYMIDNFPNFESSFRDVSFKDNLYDYKRYLLSNSNGQFVKGIDTFARIAKQRYLTDQVRHAFNNVSEEDVQGATFNLIQFCCAVGENSQLLQRFNEKLDLWKNKSSVLELSKELYKVKFQLHMTTRERTELLSRIGELEQTEKEHDHMTAKIHLLDSELELVQLKNEKSKERVDGLRQERNRWKTEKNKVEQKLAGLSQEKDYLRNILHMTLYTRTRLDYERSIVQLTPEQKGVLESISLKNDFLVKGGAGTGKTLVLLEALKQVNEGTLDYGEKSVLLLTYTKTLVKYDRYVSDIMEMGKEGRRIKTADSYLNQLFSDVLPYKVDYFILNQCLKENKHSVLKPRELELEIETYIYGMGITREEYIDQMIIRRGLKIRLPKEKRIELWQIKEEIEKEMISRKQLSKGFARSLYLDWLEENAASVKDRPDHIFLDESQDLCAMELKILKQLAKISLIMAGDSDQTIYGIHSPYKRADLELQGRTRILRQNYRNTIPIHNLAESFRRGGKDASDSEIAPVAFREGPMPELYASDKTEELYRMLVDKVKLFIESVDYDPENICILAPQKKFLDKIEEQLNIAGINSARIQDNNFDFNQKGSVRLSTLHSSKGLDLPVTMLFLPKLFYGSGLSAESGEQQMRNLIYVSMTRAMEHLNVFVKEESDDLLVKELVQLME